MAKKKATKKVKALPKKKASTKKVTKKKTAKGVLTRAPYAKKATRVKAKPAPVKPVTNTLNSGVTPGQEVALAVMESEGVFDKADPLSDDEDDEVYF